MTPQALLVELIGRGFTLAAEGDGIRVNPSSRLTAAESRHSPPPQSGIVAHRLRIPILARDQIEVTQRLAELKQLAVSRGDGPHQWEAIEPAPF